MRSKIFESLDYHIRFFFLFYFFTYKCRKEDMNSGDEEKDGDGLPQTDESSCVLTLKWKKFKIIRKRYIPLKKKNNICTHQKKKRFQIGSWSTFLINKIGRAKILQYLDQDLNRKNKAQNRTSIQLFTDVVVFKVWIRI